MFSTVTAALITLPCVLFPLPGCLQPHLTHSYPPALVCKIYQDKYHRVAQQQKFIFHSSGGCKSETKVSTGLVLSEGLEANLFHICFLASGGLLAIWDFLASANSLNLCLHLHTLFSLCACLVHISPFNKDTNHIGLGSTLMTSFYLDYLYQNSIYK